MTFFTEVNEDAKTIAPEQAALGPRVGFMESFAAGWEAQVRASSQNGMYAAYADEEDVQLRAMKKAGIENMPRIGLEVLDFAPGPDSDTFVYKNAARFYQGAGDENSANRLREYDRRIDELRKQYPDLALKSSREMYEQVVRKGRDAEDKLNNQRRTFGGVIGEFMGGGAASMNPRTDPLNALTMGVGGLGKTAVARIASETGAQGVIESLNQVTGVQEQREAMGLTNGLTDAVSRVAMTAGAGGTLQALGEGVNLAAKRWFRSTPDDPAPAVPQDKQLLLEYKPLQREEPGWDGQAQWEMDAKQYQEQIVRDLMSGTRDYTDDIIPMANYGQTRQGSARARMDIDHVSSRLDAWDGELPFEIRPKAHSTLPNRIDDNFAADINIKVDGAPLDALARDVDPKLFNIYDKLADRATSYRQWLQDPRFREQQTANVQKWEPVVADLSTKIENVKYKMMSVGKKRRDELQGKLDKLMAEKEEAVNQLTIRDTPEMARIRRELIATDEKMRDLAPMVTRAYAHAKNQWDLDAPERELIKQMVREGRKDMPRPDAPILTDTYENTLQRFTPTLQDKAPILQQSAKVEAQMRPDADAADYAKAILAENEKVMTEALDSYRASLEKIVTSAQDGVVTINGQQYKFDLDADEIYIPLEDGTGTKRITIRELLEDNADAEAELKATQTCSIL